MSLCDNEILEPLLEHGAFDGIDLGALKCVNKACGNFIDWEVVQRRYKPACQDTETVHVARHRQAVADKRMGYKAALRKYRLEPKDAAHLSPSRVSWGDCISIRAVVGVAFMKHGGPAGLRQAMQPRYTMSKAYRARQATVASMQLTERDNCFEIIWVGTFP
jgi:hypothetical protein